MGFGRFLWDAVIHPNGSKNDDGWHEEWRQFQRGSEQKGQLRRNYATPRQEIQPQHNMTLRRFPEQSQDRDYNVTPFNRENYRHPAAWYHQNHQRSSICWCGRHHQEHRIINGQDGANGRYESPSRYGMEKPPYGVDTISSPILGRQYEGLRRQKSHRAYQDLHRRVPAALTHRPDHSTPRHTHGPIYGDTPIREPILAPWPAPCSRLSTRAPLRANSRTSNTGQPPIRTARARSSVATGPVRSAWPQYPPAPPAYDSINF